MQEGETLSTALAGILLKKQLRVGYNLYIY
jgi:hypothetical protein